MWLQRSNIITQSRFPLLSLTLIAFDIIASNVQRRPAGYIESYILLLNVLLLSMYSYLMYSVHVSACLINIVHIHPLPAVGLLAATRDTLLPEILIKGR